MDELDGHHVFIAKQPTMDMPVEPSQSIDRPTTVAYSSVDTIKDNIIPPPE